MTFDDALAHSGSRIVNLAARGEASSVYRVEDSAGRTRALRVSPIPPDRTAAMQRLEALADHGVTGIADILEILTVDDELGVLSEWVPGRSLRDAGDRNDRFEEGRAERWLDALLTSVGALHDRGLAHGGIDAGGVLFQDTGVALVAPTGSGTPADDVRDLADVASALFGAVPENPAWRSNALANRSVWTTTAEIRSEILPSGRERRRRERASIAERTDENGERLPLLLQLAVGLGALLLTVAVFLALGPDEEPLPDPTITGIDTDGG